MNDKCVSNFYDVYGEYFSRMARFAKGKAPVLGDENTSKEDVKYVYVFWKNF